MYAKWVGKLEDRTCLNCAAAFTTYPSQNKRYCGQKCKGAVRRKPDSEYTARVRNAYVPLGHPLVTPGCRQVQLHRLLLWESIGPGTHSCYACGTPVTWLPGRRTIKGALVVDHFDRNPLNNDLGNLKPSCQRCNNLNTLRIVQDDEAHRINADGVRLRGEPRSCERCSSPFVSWPSASGVASRGRFCSKSCAGHASAAIRWGRPS